MNKKTELKKVAKDSGLICLSKRFIKSSTKYKWKCLKCNNIWRARHNNIKRGKGCPPCARKRITEASKKYSIEDLKKIARQRGGRCLSDVYEGYQKKHLFRCEKGHEWETGAQSILRLGTWCPYCDGQRLEQPLAEIIKIANERNGKLLTKNYINSKAKLELVCHKFHKFKLLPSQIKKGQWCSECSKGMGETAVRQVFEQLLGSKFPSTWPIWLKSPKGRPLQLDGYNEELALAFEHQGMQHEKKIHHFTSSGFTHKKRLAYDQLKRTQCKKQGVKLVEIPEVPTKVHFQELPLFVANKLIGLGFKVGKKKVEAAKVKLDTSHSERKLATLRAYASLNGGELLSPSYLGSFTKHKWRCSVGHTWRAVPSNLLRKGYWCPECGNKKKGKSRRLGSIEDLKKLAQLRGGSLISTDFKGRSYPHQWQCGNCNNVFKLSQREVEGYSGRKGRWCPECYKNNRSKKEIYSRK